MAHSPLGRVPPEEMRVRIDHRLTGRLDVRCDLIKMKKTAWGIIVSSLNDTDLRVVPNVIGKTVEMLTNLDARNDSKSTSSKMSEMVELVSLKYITVRLDLSMHIDKMAALIEQL